jgi:hypothetical protein
MQSKYFGADPTVLSDARTMGSARGYPRSQTQCRQHRAAVDNHVRGYCCAPPTVIVYQFEAGVMDSCLTISGVHIKGPVQLKTLENTAWEFISKRNQTTDFAI